MEETINHNQNDRPQEAFTSCQGQILVGEQKYTIRLLKMVGATMVFISAAEPEVFDEMAVAMQMPTDQKILGSTILGAQMISDSQRMAEKLSKRFQRQIFVSLNANVDRLTSPLLEKQLHMFLEKNEAYFI